MNEIYFLLGQFIFWYCALIGAGMMILFFAFIGMVTIEELLRRFGQYERLVRAVDIVIRQKLEKRKERRNAKAN